MRRLLPNVSGRLAIELTEPTAPITPALYNQQATATATIVSLRLEADRYADDASHPLTEAELDSIAFDEPRITLRGRGAATRHVAPNGHHFTVRDLLRAIEDSERATRPASPWFGGIDVHHVFFEGVFEGRGGEWDILWGS